MTTESTSYRVGNARITRITDRLLTTLPGPKVFPDWTESAVTPWRDAMHPEMLSDDGQTLIMSVHSWLVRIDGLVVLVDTGIGNGKSRPFNRVFDQLHTGYLQRLANAGVRPDDVDLVLLTHLHVDHVGWNTRLVDGRWQPTFPNARYVYARAEEDFYATPAAASRRMIFDDSVQPLIDAGLVQRLGDRGGEIEAGFRFHPTPGHSVGHMSISLTSGGESALFGGDVMHHPLQLHHPHWNSVFCADGEQTRRSRAWVLDAIRDGGLYFSSHFPGTSVVRADSHVEGGWAFV
jgi:glyoxylase-like metal-dependent hydrolase (beta-lactamase superfamily II)